MGADAIVTLLVLVAAVVLFVTERIPFDLTALLVLVALTVGGVLTVSQGLSGFSNEATVAIAAMFILSEGVRRTGVLSRVAALVSRAGRGNYLATVGLLMAGIAAISAFINNTAAVAIFIPVAFRLSQALDVAPTRLLMPLSFAAMLGGVCTLIGTSTNLLVHSLSKDHGFPPFGMFEFTPLGLCLLGLGFLYLLTAGVRLFPVRDDGNVSERFDLKEYLTDVRLGERAQDVGRTLEDASVIRELDLHVVQVLRDGDAVAQERVEFQAGDVLRVRGNLEAIRGLLKREHLELLPLKQDHLPLKPSSGERLVEAVIAADSPLVSRPLREAELLRRYGARVVGIRHHGRLISDRRGRITLSGGDSLLLLLPSERLENLERDRMFVMLDEEERVASSSWHTAVAVAIVVAVAATAALKLLPIVIAAVTGCALMVLTRCLSVEQAYNAVNWKVIMLLAGVLPLGLAIEQTGLAETVGSGLLQSAGAWGPTAVLGAVVLVSMLLTNVVSNQATAVLLAPVVIHTAEALEISSRPLLVGVTVAASLSFISPVGYQTNTMIYGAGNYRFLDFTKVGAPLNLLLWIAATLLIPRFWPF